MHNNLWKLINKLILTPDILEGLLCNAKSKPLLEQLRKSYLWVFSWSDFILSNFIQPDLSGLIHPKKSNIIYIEVEKIQNNALAQHLIF